MILTEFICNYQWSDIESMETIIMSIDLKCSELKDILNSVRKCEEDIPFIIVTNKKLFVKRERENWDNWDSLAMDSCWAEIDGHNGHLIAKFKKLSALKC